VKSLPAWTVIFFVAVSLMGDSASAALKPEEVGIIAMANSKDSRHIAEYYAKARGIPTSHIILLEGKPCMTITRDTWDRKLRAAILVQLEKRKLSEKIRCLVTCWDVPLMIGRRSTSSPNFLARKRGLGKARAGLIDQFEKLIAASDAFGREEPPREKPPLLNSTSEEQLKTDFKAAFQNAQQRGRNMTSDADKAKFGAFFQQSLFVANGNSGILRLMAPRSESAKLTPEKQAQRALFIGRIQTLQQVIAEMGTMPGSEARDQLILDFVQTNSGLFGAIRWVDQQLHLLKKNESHSSFDSELSMIFYPDHLALSWLPNPLHYSRNTTRKRRVMMVSRLAAPSVKIVERMVDDAIATEKVGLEGNVYIDARGLKSQGGKTEPGTYQRYDQSLRDLADRLRKHTTLTVVSDNRPALFQPGDCPDAALYCGWYSVRQYIDAFEWKRGAVAYHLASYEAKWLREPLKDSNPDEKPWCPYMLNDGVCATLGPVTEPYLLAFPLPDDFFPLLLTGKMTIVEVYYLTKKFNSWTLVLVGDPLYTPYKVKPMLDVKDLPERLGGGRPDSRVEAAGQKTQ